MRFLISMNMPNANGMLTHQMTVEHACSSIDDLCDAMNNEEFLIFQLFYKRTNMSGEVWWQDRGPIILNTSCIGKVQEFIDLDRDDQSDDASRGSNPHRATRVQRYAK